MRGAFRVNGFGTTITNAFLYSVGEMECSYCRKKTQWGLYKRTKRISLLFVPTVGVNSEHALLCGKCKNGYVLSEEQVQGVMGNRYMIAQEENGIKIVPKG